MNEIFKNLQLHDCCCFMTLLVIMRIVLRFRTVSDFVVDAWMSLRKFVTLQPMILSSNLIVCHLPCPMFKPGNRMLTTNVLEIWALSQGHNNPNTLTMISVKYSKSAG
jgi:hypothetical protein